MTNRMVPLPREMLGYVVDPDPMQSTHVLDYAFAFLFSGSGLVHTHCSTKTLKSMPVADQRALLSALHAAADALAELLTSSSEDVR